MADHTYEGDDEFEDEVRVLKGDPGHDGRDADPADVAAIVVPAIKEHLEQEIASLEQRLAKKIAERAPDPEVESVRKDLGDLKEQLAKVRIPFSAGGPPHPPARTDSTFWVLANSEDDKPRSPVWHDALDLPGGAGGGAPTGASYVTTAAEAGLSAEKVLGTDVVMRGTLAARPAASLSGRLYLATDDDGGTLYRDTGAAWEQVAQGVTEAGPPNGAAGGVLSGTYPSPGFAVDMATQAELDAHLTDATDAHDASAISSVPAGSLAAVEVQAALNELDAEKTALTTFNDHSARHEDGGADEIAVTGLSGLLADAQKVTVRKNTGADVGTRARFNFIEGTGVTLTIIDDSVGGEIDVTIAAAGGGGSGTDFSRSIAQTAHGLAVGNVVRFDGTNFVKAQADSAANAETVGIVSAVADANNFTLLFGGRVTGLSGLTAGSVFFLSAATAGLLTTTEPTIVGHVSKPLLIADAATSGYFFNFRGILIGAGAERRMQMTAIPLVRSIVVGDDKHRLFITNDMDGMSLIDADASKLVSGGGGTVTVQVRNVTQGADMLSTRITIDPHEFTSYTAVVPPVIDAANDDVAVGDIIAVDVDDSGIGGSAVGPKGLGVTLSFKA